MTAARVKAHVYKDPTIGDEFVWFYNVDAHVSGNPVPFAIDYGSLQTQAEALAAVWYVLTHRDEFDFPDLVHLPGLVSPAHAGERENLMLNLDLAAEHGLKSVLHHADQLVDEPEGGDRNVEYMRGQVELIASLFAASDLDSAQHAICHLLGWPTEGICS